MSHEILMERCLELAAQGLGSTLSNPLVGCVLVANGEIIGEGFHQKYGEAHAEVKAIENARMRGHETQCAELYVNLEPCSHHGKTPPCADLVIDSGIKKVHIASLDPNPVVSGNGVKRLQQAGIEVETDLLRQEAEHLNRRFFHFHRKKVPYIVLKWTQSADGFIDGTEKVNKQISDDYSNLLVHKWRSEEMAILIGRGTVQKDDPLLNVRHWKGRQPTRLLIDPTLASKESLNFYQSPGKAIVFTYSDEQYKCPASCKFVHLSQGEDLLTQVMQHLYSSGIVSVLVEGGAFTTNALIKSGYWNEARVITSSMYLENGIRAPQITGKLKNRSKLVNDYLDIYQP